MTNIEAIFYQVQEDKRDWDVLHFLWWEDIERGGRPIMLCMKVHMFRGVRSPANTAFVLRRAFQDAGEEFKHKVRSTIDSFYGDSLFHSVHSEREAIKITGGLRATLKKRGFRLHKWASNAKSVIDSILETEIEQMGRAAGPLVNKINTGRALGVIWDRVSNSLSVRTEVSPHKHTRRGILSTFSAVYDPLGIIAPFTIRAKIIFQSECRFRRGWGKPISKSNELWKGWL